MFIHKLSQTLLVSSKILKYRMPYKANTALWMTEYWKRMLN